MVFSSAIFLFVFLPAVFVLDRLLRGIRAKNILLLAASLIFYSFGQPVYLPLLLLSVVLNYVCGLIAAGKYPKLGVGIAVAGGIGLLAVFKYADFVIGTVNNLFGLSLPLTGIALPIGISFFTFQGLSYVIDVYRDRSVVSRSFVKILLYISFFPQLIAGPIVKYHDIEKEIDQRQTTPRETALGIRRFICGLSKKLLISNAMGQMADAVFALPVGEIGMFAGWMGAICYTLQIYFDFSGYSDMAIGMGRMFGFHFLENFNYPYASTTIQEFWRRWHISLSSWLKDYLYISLGGNRKGRARTYANLMLTMLLGGLWHGAAVRFILWGALHGAALAVHKALMHAFPSVFKASGEQMRPWRRVLGVLVTFHVVCLGWILFRAPDMQTGERILSQIFGHFQWRLIPQVVSGYGAVMALMAAGYLLHMLPRRAEAWGERTVAGAPLVVKALMLTVLIWCVMQIKSSEIQPFIYFQF